ncbi:MAG: DNA polymerase III subunit epsilon [Geminicoccaceae bacterium]|nr:DNA polymerase III subunit epsilon [Geminicoccaceae bacterium]
MREVVLDTETTGLEPELGHRIVELGAIELINHVPSGRTFHAYVNPERDMPDDALRVHGLTSPFLAGQPLFADVVDGFLAFLDQDHAGAPQPAKLVAHNASFDVAFINMELARLGRPPLPPERVVDTLPIARQRFPGAPNSLDALCRRFEVDASARTRHGALLDSELLAEVYLGLLGGRQPGFELIQVRVARAADSGPRVRREPRPHRASPEELAAHAAFLERIKDPVWLR